MFNKRKKEYGGVILRSGCTNSCVFCGTGVGKRRVYSPSEVRPARIKEDAVNCYKNLIDFKKQRINNIEISGSDPLEYERITQMIKYMNKMGFETIVIATNGVKLSNKRFLNRFIKSGINELRIPLYGSNPKIHDSVTQTPGSFICTLRGIKGVLKKAPDIKIQITSLILKQNKDNLLDLLNLVEGKLKIKNMNFSIPCVANNDYSYYVPIKNLTPYIRKVYDHASKMNYKISFREIPYCVFGFIDKSTIDNTSLPPNLGEHCQPSLNVKTSIKDMPSYRLKRKIGMCKNCRAFSFCDGFFVNDIDKFGIGSLKPFLE